MSYFERWLSLPIIDLLFFTIIRFNEQLEKFGVDVEQLQKPASHRLFRAWIEDWERSHLTTNDSVAEASLLAKYKGLRFYLPDDEVTYTIHEDNLEFQRGSKRLNQERGWNVFGVPPNANGDDDDEPFMINNVLCELIANTDQEDGVEVIQNEKMPANEDGNDDDDGEAEV